MAKSTTTKTAAAAPTAYAFDVSRMMEQMKGPAQVGEKLTQVALAAAERSHEVSNAWTKATLANVGGVAKLQDHPADYAKAMTEFAKAQNALASENVHAFADIAQSVREQMLDILIQAGQSVGEQATAALERPASAAPAATPAKSAPAPSETPEA